MPTSSELLTHLPYNVRDVVLADPPGWRQCAATSKHTGQRCRRPPSVGGFTCDLHGGKTPNALSAAKERLNSLVEPAISALMRCLQSPGVCAACGRSDDMAVMERAARTVLDRCGHGPTSTSKVEVTRRVDVVLASMDDAQLADLAEYLARTVRSGEYDVPELAAPPLPVDAEGDDEGESGD